MIKKRTNIAPKYPRQSQPPKVSRHSDTGTPPVVYILSDSTGNLARHMLAAFITQFPTDAIAPQFHTFIRGEHRLDEVLHKIQEKPGAVCHAMVSDPFKERIAAFCRKTGLP